MSPPEPTTNSRWWYIVANLDGHHERARASRPTGASMTRWSRSRRARAEPNPADVTGFASSASFQSTVYNVLRLSLTLQFGSGGRLLKPRTSSTRRATRSSVTSSRRGATSCTPNGSPSELIPLGKLIDGQPIRDQGDWNDGSPVVSRLGARFDGRQQERVELGGVLGRFRSQPSAYPLGLKIGPARHQLAHHGL